MKHTVGWLIVHFSSVAFGSLSKFAATPNTPDRYIFDQNTGEKLTKPCSREQPVLDSLWKPTEAQVDKLEAQFGKCLSHKKLAPLNDYFRQYIGIKRGKKKLIYLSGHSKDQPDPKYDNAVPQVWCDGGADVFGVEFDPSNSSFQNFEFNGPEINEPVVDNCKSKKK